MGVRSCWGSCDVALQADLSHIWNRSEVSSLSWYPSAVRRSGARQSCDWVRVTPDTTHNSEILRQIMAKATTCGRLVFNPPCRRNYSRHSASLQLSPDHIAGILASQTLKPERSRIACERPTAFTRRGEGGIRIAGKVRRSEGRSIQSP